MSTTIRIIILTSIVLLLTPQQWAAGEQIRTAVWAGRFYPRDADTLTTTIQQLIDNADCRSAKSIPTGRLKALILPHAGYIYSGPIAAHAHCVLNRTTTDKVILMGPDHRVGFSGGAISAVDAYETPLGRVHLHADAHRLRRQDHLFQADAQSDSQEHSLEVVLPFLQYSLGGFELVPIVLGPSDPTEIAAHLQTIIDDQTLMVVSADLSHYLPYDQAVARDKETIAAILQGRIKRLAESNRTCGRYPVSVLLVLAQKHHWTARLLDYANSGDTAGDRKKVVGYAAIGFYQNGENSMSPSDSTSSSRLTDIEGKSLVLLARSTLLERFGRKLPQAQLDQLNAELKAGTLQKVCGTFVTLKINNQLRGCIGSLEGREPLATGVATQAINAAFHDPRFAQLTEAELDRISIEVSVLSHPEPLAYADAEELLAKLRPHVDGVTISKGFAGATFLPQVWEQLPRTEDFLSHLCLKAGLGAKAWRKGDLKVETYQVQYFEETH
jgi:AmmeMemoRadiSam system protein B/AmmeMemoRadiSam system protein A